MSAILSLRMGSDDYGINITVFNGYDLEYIICGQYGTKTLDIVHNEQHVASIFKESVKFKKSAFRLDFLEDASITFSPKSFSSGWTAQLGNGEQWDIKGSSDHTVVYNDSIIGRVKSSLLYKGAHTVEVEDSSHKLALVGLAAALFLRDLPTKPRTGTGCGVLITV